MKSKRSNNEIYKRKDPVANNYREKYPERILCTSIPNNSGVGFYVKKNNYINCGDD